MRIMVNKGENLHLCGASTIANMFGVSKKTISRWREMGAPIICVGKKYQACYAELWHWLKDNSGEIEKSLSSGLIEVSAGHTE